MAFPSPPPFPNAWTWASSCQQTHWTDNGNTSCDPECNIYQIYTTESTLSYTCLPPGYGTTTNSWTWYGTWAPGSCPDGFTTITSSVYSVRQSSVGVAICCASGYTYNPGAQSCGSSYSTSMTVFGSTRSGEARRTTVVGAGQKHMQAYTLWSTYGQAVAGSSPQSATVAVTTTVLSTIPVISTVTSAGSTFATTVGSSTVSSELVETTVSRSTGRASAVPNPGDSGLSTGAKAGIAVGVVGGVLLILAGLLFFFFRRKKQMKQRKETTSNTGGDGLHEVHGDAARHEIDSKTMTKPHAELNSPDAEKQAAVHHPELEAYPDAHAPYHTELDAYPQPQSYAPPANAYELGGDTTGHNAGHSAYGQGQVPSQPVSATSPYYEQSRAMPFESHLPIRESNPAAHQQAGGHADDDTDAEIRRLEEEVTRLREKKAQQSGRAA